MKPGSFNYLRAASVDEVLEALATHREEARILAGGLSLGAMLNYRLLEPGLLIDISTLGELSYIRNDGDWIEVGAGTTQAELMAWPNLAGQAPLLAAALPNIGHFQTRSRGTVCGSICHGEPSSELPLCFATLGGEAVLKSSRGTRRLPAAAFQSGMLSNARAADELVCAVRFPVSPKGTGAAFREFAQRKGDFAIVAVAALSFRGSVRIGIGGVADRPAIREWEKLSNGKLDDRLNALAWELGGDTDIHATARYRRHLVRRLGKRAIEEAVQCQS